MVDTPKPDGCNLTQGQWNRLSVAVRQEIRRLCHDVMAAEAVIMSTDAGHATNIAVRVATEKYVRYPDHTHVKFRLPSESQRAKRGVIDVSVNDDGELVVNGSETIAVIPYATNAVRIRTVPR